MIFAFQILPTIIFIAALFAILYYIGVMQIIVRLFAVVMNKVMGASGAESLNVAASIFMGQTEAPLTIRPFLPRMTQSELMTVMTSGMAHISGGIMAAYIAFGIEAKHLLTAVIMTAPGTLMMAKMFVPETETPETRGTVKLEIETTDVNIIDAAGRGTAEGLHLALNVGAMLISFVALIFLVNAHPRQPSASSMQMIFGWVFAPVAWSLGVPWKDAAVVGNLLGTRMVLNEFIAFAQLGALKESLDPRSFTIATFALCGFANFASIGMQIGGIGALAPTRRSDLARLGLRAMLAGTLANFVTAIIVGFSAVSATFEQAVGSRRVAARHAAAAAPTSPSCSARGSAISPITSASRSRFPTATFRTGRRRASSVMPASWSAARSRGRTVLALSGRVHHYEGHDMQTVTFAMRALGRLGVPRVILTNAAGGISPNCSRGALMVIDDHINLMGNNPLVGPNDERFGLRFPGHDQRLLAAAARASPTRPRPALGVAVQHGVYIAVLGPSYETPAEIRAFRTLGADAVGMSTAPEAIVARHMGIEVLGISCITNAAAGVLPGAVASLGSDGNGAAGEGAVHRAARGHHWPALIALGRRAARAAPASTPSPTSPTSRSAPPSRPTTGDDHHRLQRRERQLRPDDLRRARGDLQGALGGQALLHAHRRRRRHRGADAAVRRLPPDHLGVLRRHRGRPRQPHRGDGDATR